jgi:hypothetical protein
MTALLEKALQQLEAQPPDTQDAIASQIIEALEDEAWERSFATSHDVLQKMAQEAIAEDQSGEIRPLDELL